MTRTCTINMTCETEKQLRDEILTLKNVVASQSDDLKMLRNHNTTLREKYENAMCLLELSEGAYIEYKRKYDILNGAISDVLENTKNS